MNAIRGRLMGLDIGERRIGVAVSDVNQTIASPVSLVHREDKPLEHLKRLADEYEVTELVAGLPTGMSGREGPQAADVREFAVAAAATLNLPLVYWDERLTSVQAERSLIEAGHARKKRKTLIDAVAAALMLQSFLDARAVRRSPSG